MLTLRKSEERGKANHGWLKSYHSFSFANYYDPQHMGFRKLRVINEDRIEPGMGFGPHSHRDMEIITYVIEGELAHKDSLGNSDVIHANEVQIMSAGTGIMHSEFNASSDQAVHLLQIWLLPNQAGLSPRYDQKIFSTEEKENQLRLLVSPDGREGSLLIHQDVSLYATQLQAGKQVEHSLQPSRHAWIQIVTGEVSLNEQTLQAGDAIALAETGNIVIEANTDTELLLFDLA